MKHPKLLLLLLPLPITVVFACTLSVHQNQRTATEQNSFCYWNTSYDADTALMNATETNHLYLRYFDVDWDDISQEGKPVASFSTWESIPVKITPSVFFTNKVFEKSSKEQLKKLSERVKTRIEGITAQLGRSAFRQDEEYYKFWLYCQQYDSTCRAKFDSLENAFINDYKSKVTDILIDCDWTAGTQEKFFYFIECLKKDCADKEITVTLRLWQYKRNKPKDIPPVDRCLLMCYNMQALNDYRVENSIASFEELKKYVSGKKYPLKLDVALPIFNWAILFRNEQFMGI